MRLFALIAKVFASKKTRRKTIQDYQKELFLRQGREELQKILKFGRVPVTFL